MSVTSESIAELYRDIYEEASAQNTLDHPETIAAIAERLGEHGYPASDTENRNRFNMVCWEQADAFCRQAKEGQHAFVTIFSVLENGGFIRFGLESADGSVTVNRSVLSWKNGSPYVSYQNSYPACDWTYTEEGYLFFDEYSTEGYDGAPGYTALRIKPLDGECRRLNEACIAPVGYGANNMFLLDWTEDEYNGLDFNDLFLRLYPVVLKAMPPYETTVDGATYCVPEKTFEAVLLSCFTISRDTLRARVPYDSETGCYEYASRGFYDASLSPNLPYPEVVACTEHADKTLTLTVNAVYPKQHLSRAFCHEVTVRPTEDGGFQYVSNHITQVEY